MWAELAGLYHGVDGSIPFDVREVNPNGHYTVKTEDGQSVEFDATKLLQCLQEPEYYIKPFDRPLSEEQIREETDEIWKSCTGPPRSTAPYKLR